MAEIKRIFLTGAPGSTWGRVDKCLRGALDNVDNTDILPQRMHDPSKGMFKYNSAGDIVYNHLGAFYNPGNEFGNWILDFRHYTKEEIETKLDDAYRPDDHPEIVEKLGAPWMNKSGDRSIRIHKSHYFAYHLDKIADLWPDAAIVLTWQENHKCYVWWESSEGFKLAHDGYTYYQDDYEAIWNQVRWQNAGIERFVWERNLQPAIHNMDWIRDQFGQVSGVSDIREDLSNPDGIPRLHITPGGQRNVNNTTRVYCLNPWK